MWIRHSIITSITLPHQTCWHHWAMTSWRHSPMMICAIMVSNRLNRILWRIFAISSTERLVWTASMPWATTKVVDISMGITTITISTTTKKLHDDRKRRCRAQKIGKRSSCHRARIVVAVRICNCKYHEPTEWWITRRSHWSKSVTSTLAPSLSSVRSFRSVHINFTTISENFTERPNEMPASKMNLLSSLLHTQYIHTF